LLIKEDLAEEIGRVYGYKNIASVPISKLSFKAKPLKAYVYANIIRDVLVAQGFSEVYTYSFQKEGVFAILNPIAEDKGFLRKDLGVGLRQALVLNTRNALLFGLDEIKIFEIGKVFPAAGEEKLVCAFAVDILNAGKKKDAQIKDTLEYTRSILVGALGTSIEISPRGPIFEFDLGGLLQKLPNPVLQKQPFRAAVMRYHAFSAYPFVLRDIALWVPKGVESATVHGVIRKEAGELLVSSRLFDVFTKEFPEGKKDSYAFNLVFQSHEKTLSDEEVMVIMKRITKALVGQIGWVVR
jgi:phenylalanyl-tRNA synthetase beta chain